MPKHFSPGSQKSQRSIIPVVLAVVALLGLGVGLFWLAFGQRVTANEPPAQERVPREGASNVPKEGEAAPDEGHDLSSAQGTARGEASSSELSRMLRAGEVSSIRLIGDSITAGFGTNGYNEAVQAEGNASNVIYDDGNERQYETPASVECWANAFRSYAQDKGVKSFVNAGINGAFMNRLADAPDAWLGPGADVVFVALGTNDAGYYGAEEFRVTAQEALAAAAKKSKLVVVLAPVRDLRPVSQLVEPAAELGDVLQAICEECGYLFVDPREAVTPAMFNDDGLHPSSEGSLAIWRCIQSTLGLE